MCDCIGCTFVQAKHMTPTIPFSYAVYTFLFEWGIHASRSNKPYLSMPFSISLRGEHCHCRTMMKIYAIYQGSSVFGFWATFPFELTFIMLRCARKKIGAERCECVFDLHTSKASKELKVVLLLHLWCVNVKTTGGFIYISLEEFHMDKTAP